MGIEVQFLENLQLKRQKLWDRNATCPFETQIIEVDIIVVFNCHDYAGQHQTVYVVFVESEFRFGHVVPI